MTEEDHHNVQIPIEEEYEGADRHIILDDILNIQRPENPKRTRAGIVVFVHGSGSSGRHSPRNRYVASVLNSNESGIGTLLVDLLTAEEQEIDEKTRKYRFNIRLLANRLTGNMTINHKSVILT